MAIQREKCYKGLQILLEPGTLKIHEHALYFRTAMNSQTHVLYKNNYNPYIHKSYINHLTYFTLVLQELQYTGSVENINVIWLT